MLRTTSFFLKLIGIHFCLFNPSLYADDPFEWHHNFRPNLSLSRGENGEVLIRGNAREILEFYQHTLQFGQNTVNSAIVQSRRGQNWGKIFAGKLDDRMTTIMDGHHSLVAALLDDGDIEIEVRNWNQLRDLYIDIDDETLRFMLGETLEPSRDLRMVRGGEGSRGGRRLITNGIAQDLDRIGRGRLHSRYLNRFSQRLALPTPPALNVGPFSGLFRPPVVAGVGFFKFAVQTTLIGPGEERRDRAAAFYESLMMAAQNGDPTAEIELSILYGRPDLMAPGSVVPYSGVSDLDSIGVAILEPGINGVRYLIGNTPIDLGSRKVVGKEPVVFGPKTRPVGWSDGPSIMDFHVESHRFFP